MAQIPVPQGGATIKRRSDGASFFMGEGSQYDPSVYDVVSGRPTTQPSTVQPATQSFQPITREQELQQIRDKLAGIKAQAETITTSGRSLLEAEQRGLTITPSTSVQDATRYLREIDQSKAPAKDISQDLYGTNALAAGLKTGIPTFDMLNAEMQKIKTQKEAGTSALNKLLGQKPEPISVEETQKKAFESLGLPADFTRQQFDTMQRTNAEVLALQTDLASLNTQEQQSLVRIEEQAIPLENISRQQNRVIRDTSIKKAGIAAQIQAKAAYLESVRGNFQIVNQLIEQTVKYAFYEKEQETNDWKWMFDTYKAEWDSLSKREQDLFDTRLNLIQRETELEKDEMRDKISLYLDNGLEIPDVNSLKTKSFAEVAVDVSKNRGTGLTEEIVGGFRVLRDVTGKVISTREVDNDLGKEELLSGIENRLLQSRISPSLSVDPKTYTNERTKAKIGPDEFDKRFGHLLSPQDQSKLGIASVTVKKELTSDQLGFVNSAKARIDQAKFNFEDVVDIRDQIIEQTLRDYGFDISPYI